MAFSRWWFTDVYKIRQRKWMVKHLETGFSWHNDTVWDNTYHYITVRRRSYAYRFKRHDLQQRRDV